MDQNSTYFEGSDAEFLNFLCGPEMGQQQQPQQYTTQIQEQGQGHENHGAMMQPMRVPPMPRLPMNSQAQGMRTFTRMLPIPTDDLINDTYDMDDKKKKIKNDPNKIMTAKQKVERR